MSRVLEGLCWAAVALLVACIVVPESWTPDLKVMEPER